MGVALDHEQQTNANTIFQMSRSAGLSPQRAQEVVFAAYKESGLRTHADNPTSHAHGLMQLLSAGYRQRAVALGGLDDPRANVGAILPDYVHYFAANPHAVPGAAASAVERSGQPAAWYAPDGSAAAPGGATAPAALPTLGTSLGGISSRRTLPPLAQYALDSLRTRFDRTAAPPTNTDLMQAVAEQHGGSSSSGEPAMGMAPGGPAGGIVQTAKAYLGVPYKWGGNDPATGIDCSAFVQQVYAAHGVKLPRTTTGQFHAGQHVDLEQLQPGDVVFTQPGKGPLGGPGHEGLYVGGGMVQESPHTGAVNRIIPLASYVSEGFAGARRYGG